MAFFWPSSVVDRNCPSVIYQQDKWDIFHGDEVLKEFSLGKPIILVVGFCPAVIYKKKIQHSRNF